MDKRIVQFIREAAQTIIGLDLALYLQANPKTFDTAAGLALRLRHPVEAVEPIAERFVEHGIMRKVISRDSSYHCYTLQRTPKVWNLLCLISETYIDDPETRKAIVKLLIRRQGNQRASQATESESLPPN